MRRGSRWLLGTYLVLLAVSKVARTLHPAEWKSTEGVRTVTVGAVRHDSVFTDPVRIAFLELNRSASSTILLLHGSPGDHREVGELARLLSSDYHVIAPDLPGFGGSSRNLPDYSFRSHGRYVLQLLDSLGIPRAHVLGFSMGGGVALSMVDLAPSRVDGLVMLSAIGAQEYELLGDYTLNHALHGLQLAGLWLLREGVPHMGYLDDSAMGVEYARNFFDSDQRPLRRILAGYAGPLLLIHGEHDPLVAPAAAIEHHRLVPQSELRLLPGNHFMAFTHPEELATPIAEFLRRVERGTARVRSTADASRLLAAARPFDPASLPPTGGLALLILLALLAAATLVSEDLTCIATGLLIARGTLGFIPGTLACFLGIVCGDLLLFLAGRWLGRAALSRAPLKWFVEPSTIERASDWIRRRGPVLVLTSRFIPGTRLPTYVAAGILRTDAVTFAGYFLLAGALWTPLLVGTAALLGDGFRESFMRLSDLTLPGLILLAFGLFGLVRLAVSLASYRGRRLLLSRWRRLTRWEFWPPWLFYPPVVAYILVLALKHRSATLFTSVNPGIPGGGFAGESKFDILAALGPSDRIATSGLIPGTLTPELRLDAARRFMAEHALRFPIVLKPDIGERGSGVAVIRSADAMAEYLERSTGDVIVQEFIAGEEFGVFYYRLPGEPAGRIFSITEKRFPSVVGDGRRTLEDLILRDERAVCVAELLLRRHAASLESVPAAGTRVALVELGTHCRGAAFFDGGRLHTGELEREIDRVSQGFDGFWFGRYDLRVPSGAALAEGRDFKVIELNGATAEATSIYDPSNGLLSAYRTLWKQWRLLYEIAERNRGLGHRPASLAHVIGMLRRHRTAIRAHVAA